MQEVTTKILNKVGLHARPAKELVKFSKGIQSNVTVSYNGKSANIKSMMAVMALGAKQDAEVTWKIEGPDEAEVAQKITEMVTNGFGFPEEL